MQYEWPVTRFFSRSKATGTLELYGLMPVQLPAIGVHDVPVTTLFQCSALVGGDQSQAPGVCASPHGVTSTW